MVRIGKVNLGTKTDLVVASLITVAMSVAVIPLPKNLKKAKANQIVQLKSYNLPKDEYNRLSARINAQNIFNQSDGFHILDSLAQDKKDKQFIEQGKQYIRDSLNKVQQKLAVKNFSAKVDTTLKALKR